MVSKARCIDGTRAQARCPDVRIIAFSRGAKTRLTSFLGEASIDALGLDTSDDVNGRLKTFRRASRYRVTLTLSFCLLAEMPCGVRHNGSSRVFAGGPHIFNLGHGILPTTPIENVELLLSTIRQG